MLTVYSFNVQRELKSTVIGMFTGVFYTVKRNCQNKWGASNHWNGKWNGTVVIIKLNEAY